MKRVVAAVLGVLLLPVIGAAPASQAGSGIAVCTINGTVKFSPSVEASSQGTWHIGPASMECHGSIYGQERIIGRGPFAGSGSIGLVPTGTAPCAHDLGPGTIDYTIPTTAGPLRIVEPIVAGAGLFNTSNMAGSFQFLPPYEGDCVTEPVTKTVLVAEGLFTRRAGKPSLP